MMDEKWEKDKNLNIVLSEIGEKYDLEEKLGGGGYSTVYLIRHKILNTKFALKILDTGFIEKSLQKINDTEKNEEEFSVIKERFINEGKYCINIRHPNIVGINDVGIASDEDKDYGVPYLIMEYIEGESLSKKITGKNKIKTDDIFKISQNILSAVQEIHKKNIIHRDIKSRNVMIRDDTVEAVLIDFGIAKELKNKMKLTGEYVSLGTSQYMPPEQFNSLKEVDKKGDIYSFGVMLYEMITGEAPFKGNPHQVMKGHVYDKVPDIIEKTPEAPPGFQEIIEKAMKKKPEDRFRSAREFSSALKKLENKLKKEKKKKSGGTKVKKKKGETDLDAVKRKISQDYFFIRSLNKGGFSHVYLIRHKNLDTLRILKVMRYEHLSGKGENELEDCKERFSREGRLLEKINHENIVKLHDFGFAGGKGIPYLVMGHVKGKSLQELIDNNTSLTIEESINVASDILLALREMHKIPIIHRDVKPSNIMIEEESGKAILIDFGLAKNIGNASSITTEKKVIGSSYYMSPEQWKGISNLGPESDIYSLGIVFYELLTGERPFKGENDDDLKWKNSNHPIPDPRDINPDLPKGIHKIISRAMAKEQADRYKNAGGFLADLKEVEDKYKRQQRIIKETRGKIEHHPDLEEVMLNIGDTYKALKYLKKGRYSLIYLVQHKTSGFQRILKVMSYEYILGKNKNELKECKDRFIREGRVLANITQENIVKLYGFGLSIEKEIPYLVMRYVKGNSLRELLDKSSPLSFKKSLKVTANILSAFREMHQASPPVIHRNIKPSNIMIEAESGKAILIDFGLVKVLGNISALTTEKKVIGSSYYMSPEHWDGISNLIPASDIYSLGIVFFEMLTGERPYNGDSDKELLQKHLNEPVPDPREINPDLPKGIHKLLRKAMAKKPEKRYRSPDEFLADLKNMEAKYKKKSKKIKRSKEKREEKAKKEAEQRIKSLEREKEEAKNLLLKEQSKIKEAETAFNEAEENKTKKTVKLNAAIKEKEDAEEKAQKLKDEVENARKKTEEEIKKLQEVETKAKEKLEKERAKLNELIDERNTAEQDIHDKEKVEEEAALVLNRESKKIDKTKEAKEKAEAEAQELKKKIESLKTAIDDETRKLNRYREASGSTEKYPNIIDGSNAEIEVIKPHSNLFKYLLIFTLVFTAVMLIIINPLNIHLSESGADEQYESHISFVNAYIESGQIEKAKASLEDAKKIKDTSEIKKLSDQIRQILAMKTDFESLTGLIGEDADKENKRAALKEFLDRHKDAPEHKEKQDMLDWADRYIKQIDEEIKSGKEISDMQEAFQALNIGETIQAKAAKEKKIAECRLFLNNQKNVPQSMVKQTNDYIAKLRREISNEEEAYERKNGKKEYDRIKNRINLSKYLDFVREYPNSVFIRDLKQRLLKSDPNLPPEDYWTAALAKNKNSKGYYEKTFANGHLMIYIPEKKFWIDKYEVSNKQFRSFESVNGEDNLPVTVTYEKAQKYCKAYGFELPKKEEWEYAAGKAKGYTYPWGNQAPDAGGIYRANFDTLKNDKDQDGYTRTAPVKSFEQFSSPFEVVNMAGNVWEWVQGEITKGGGFLSVKKKLRISYSGKSDLAGFRCIKKEK